MCVSVRLSLCVSVCVYFNVLNPGQVKRSGVDLSFFDKWE